jgi:hypothetical protein
LSQVAGDHMFGGSVLAAMSHQALHLGQLQDGIDFAAAATRDGSAGYDTTQRRASSGSCLG